MIIYPPESTWVAVVRKLREPHFHYKSLGRVMIEAYSILLFGLVVGGILGFLFGLKWASPD